jgi:regulatory protein
MENEESAKKALNAAYGFISRRPHSIMELKGKLAGKNFSNDLIEAAIDNLLRTGYLNDEEISHRWAQFLVKNRGWGRVRIAFYLLKKGISRDIIDNVQRKIWQEFSEEEIARKALEKRFFTYGGQPTSRKQAAFLNSRGFSSDIIRKLIGDIRVKEEE